MVLESALDKVARVATGVQDAVTAAALKIRDQVWPRAGRGGRGAGQLAAAADLSSQPRRCTFTP